MGRLTEEDMGGRIHALNLAGKGHEVEIRLEDLGLAPARFDGPGRAHLPHLLRKRAWAVATTEPLVEQGGELHRDRAGAACAVTRQPVEDRSRDGTLVHTAMS